MPINITMPALSPTMEEGNLAKWLVKEGDKVKSGDVIAEIETDKATMEVEAVDEGVIAKLVVPAGAQGVKVNSVIAILAGEGEDAGAAAATSISPLAGEMSAKPTEGRAQPTSAAQSSSPAPAASSPPPLSVGSADTQGTSHASRPPSAPAGEKADGSRTFASPLARRIAKDAGLDVATITGSGPKGRVVKSDVEAAVSAGTARAPAAPGASTGAAAPISAPNGASDAPILKLFAEGTYELVPHDGMRKTIAKRLQESKQTIPHFYVSVDCELDALLALRTQLNAGAPVAKTEKGEVPAYKISVNDMVIKALALALRDVPDANVSWTDTNMVKHKHADVGVAVSIPGGLITPIIRSAELKTLSAISGEMKDLGARAKARKLKPEEYQGGTTAVSNMGMMGVKNFAAVVNPPHATILAVGAGEERVVVKRGEMKVAQVMTVTLSTDHRAVDGALGAELLGAFKRYVENPLSMLV
jgi:pyruvate dehydrogenase E2 component (dihydrolipoamide acetyltransferase)